MCPRHCIYIYMLIFIIVVIENKALKELDQRLSTGIKGCKFIYDFYMQEDENFGIDIEMVRESGLEKNEFVQDMTNL